LIVFLVYFIAALCKEHRALRAKIRNPNIKIRNKLKKNNFKDKTGFAFVVWFLSRSLASSLTGISCFFLILLCHINYEMKTTVGFTSFPNVVIGDPVAGNTLDPR
jgi:hypothetical protein